MVGRAASPLPAGPGLRTCAGIRGLRSLSPAAITRHHCCRFSFGCGFAVLRYVGPMWHHCRVIGLIQAALLSFGLSGLSSRASEMEADPSAPSITNVSAQQVVRDAIVISNQFAGFIPGSLANVVWTGFHTNGRSTNMWEVKQLPPGWPKTPPVLRWNTNNLMWGRKGVTAICQVIEGMGSFGQGAMTALTRRHGYVRGHDMGPNGLDPTRVGRRVWFCTRDNQLVERRIKLLYIRAREQGSTYDYSIILFDADLPPAIEPMRVADHAKVWHKYLFGDSIHKPVFMALQEGRVSANVPGWIVPVRGGDSGNPIMLPLPDELVFFGGITTSPPGAQMQADMDLLSRKAGLDPRKYQMQWVDLDAYPDPTSKP
jgi:hypothetical protein